MPYHDDADPTELITSPRNPLLKRVRGLLRHDTTDEVIAVEGLRAIIEAARAGVAFRQVLYAPDRVRSALAEEALDLAEEQGAQVVPVAAAALDEVSARDASQGMIALVQRPDATLDDLAPTEHPLIVALFEPQDPGNVGTIARTADGAGAAALVVLGERAVDAFHPRAIRASMGSLFALPIITLLDVPAGITTLRARGLALVGAAGSGAMALWHAPLTGPVAILLGNERAGLPDDVLAACDAVARIPLTGHADSLNVAAAAAIFLFEAVRQRTEPL